MKIAFDHQIFMLQSYGGISRYFVRLAQELITKGEDLRIIAPIHCNHYLADLPESNVVGRQIAGLPPKAIRLLSAINRYSCTRTVRHFRPTVVHETYYSSSTVAISGAARISTVHDMIHEKFPGSFSARNKTSGNKRTGVDRADHIICVSHSTKRDLCELFDVPPEKVSVVHLGFERFADAAGHSPSTTQRRPFLLYVGSRGGYKNFNGMLRAVASRRELSSEFDIIAFGGGAFDSSETRLIQSLELRPGSVQQISGNDDVLGELYCGASALVYPSLYEGFGLPPLEAMAHDCPVVTSNTSSMPEVVGQAGEFFTPDDIEDQAQAICNVVFDKLHRDVLVQAGKERLGSFSWRQCAEETLQIYERFL